MTLKKVIIYEIEMILFFLIYYSILLYLTKEIEFVRTFSAVGFIFLFNTAIMTFLLSTFFKMKGNRLFAILAVIFLGGFLVMFGNLKIFPPILMLVGLIMTILGASNFTKLRFIPFFGTILAEMILIQVGTFGINLLIMS